MNCVSQIRSEVEEAVAQALLDQIGDQAFEPLAYTLEAIAEKVVDAALQSAKSAGYSLQPIGHTER
jgi:hypothetical protein